MASQVVDHSKEETMKVKITSKSHVKPNKKLGRRECQLITFDLPYLAFYYNQKFLLYKGSNDSFANMVGKLKDSLRVVLEDFYLLAAKIGKDEEGVFRIEYDDNMEGVELVEAIAEGISVDDLTAEDGSTTTLKDFIPWNGVLNLEGLHRPLLAVQLTKLKDGLAMGCAFNHAILDGTSTWHFMSSWAEICKGSHSISIPPFLERTKARNTRVKFDISLSTDRQSTSHCDAKSAAPELREKVFKFSETAIDRIKSIVNTNPPLDGLKSYSTFQSLTAHIWRHVSRARELKAEESTVFIIFADCRKRVEPPMPDSYFGNLIKAIFTAVTVGQLLGNPLEFGASVIQKTIEAHNAKAIEERAKEWESAPKVRHSKDIGVNCIAIGSSPRFRVYEVDFGWGKPESVRSGSNNRFDGMVYLYPGKSGGRSIDVDITLEAGAMERLKKDKDFLLEP
ncbi:BAHD acyltransferase DCR [Jatropha curcas]|nr:BAHD acyltransferase DCR [Jatropha curcas]